MPNDYICRKCHRHISIGEWVANHNKNLIVRGNTLCLGCGKIIESFRSMRLSILKMKQDKLFNIRCDLIESIVRIKNDWHHISIRSYNGYTIREIKMRSDENNSTYELLMAQLVRKSICCKNPKYAMGKDEFINCKLCNIPMNLDSTWTT